MILKDILFFQSAIHKLKEGKTLDVEIIYGNISNGPVSCTEDGDIPLDCDFELTSRDGEIAPMVQNSHILEYNDCCADIIETHRKTVIFSDESKKFIKDAHKILSSLTDDQSGLSYWLFRASWRLNEIFNVKVTQGR